LRGAKGKYKKLKAREAREAKLEEDRKAGKEPPAKKKNPMRSLRPNLFELIENLPKPVNYDAKDKSTWAHKNGYMLKFYRKLWLRYEEPCYYTIVKYLPSQDGIAPRQVWGIKTWRGKSEEKTGVVKGSVRRDWKLIVEPGLEAVLRLGRQGAAALPASFGVSQNILAAAAITGPSATSTTVTGPSATSNPT